MEKAQAEALAIEIVKSVVNYLSKKEYGEIFDIVNLSLFTVADITELVDGFLEVNEPFALQLTLGSSIHD